MIDSGVIEYDVDVSIQPGYPPGMRSMARKPQDSQSEFQSNPAIRRE